MEPDNPGPADHPSEPRKEAGLPEQQEVLPVVESSEDGPKGRGSAERPARREPRTPSQRPRRARTKETEGEELERRVGRVEFAEGALVRMRVPVRADEPPGRDVMTDIDVLSLDADLRLRLTRSILECKSGGGEAGELDRLFWLAGFRDFLGVERALLVREAITTRGMRLAQQLRVQLMDSRTLSDREAAHAWLPERFAHVGGSHCSDAERRTDIQLRGIATIPPSLVAFLREGALLADPHTILGALSSLSDAVRGSAVVPDRAGMVIAGHALIALLLAAVQDAGSLGSVSEEALRRRLTLALTAGDADDPYILDVLGRADELIRHEVDRVHETYAEAGTPRIDVQIASLRELVSAGPAWIDAYVDLVQRLRSNPGVARDLLQTAELVVFEALVGGGAYTADAFSHLFTPEHRSLLTGAIRTLTAVVGESLAERLAGVKSVNFDRSAPSVPNRREPSQEPAKRKAELAQTQRRESR